MKAAVRDLSEKKKEEDLSPDDDLFFNLEEEAES